DVARRAGGVGLYRSVEIFNHPPFMVHVLRLLGWIASATRLPFPLVLRLPGIAADAASVWMVARLLGPRPSPVRLIALALSPVALMISGFHGNTDPVM